MIYFKLNNQRRYIFSGSDNMLSPKKMKKENFTDPTLLKNPVNTYFAKKTGTATK